MVREVQRKSVLSKIVSIGIRDIDDPVPNAVESKFVVESAVQCVGRMGHLEDSEWRAGADNRGHRERHYDGAVHRCAHVDIRRKDRKQLEEDTVGERKDSIYLLLSIETLQLLLRLGTFQLSDIFYNTVGGVIGGLMYYGIRKVRKHL